MNQKIIPQKTALVVIDLQNGIVNRELYPNSKELVVSNAVKLVEKFNDKEIFTVLVRVTFTDGKDALNPLLDAISPTRSYAEGWDEYIPQLKDKKYFPISKRQWGAFFGTELDLQLRRRGIDTIVLCGVSSGIGVDTTAREAFQLRYNQYFVEDATSAINENEHKHVFEYIFPKIGKVRKTEEILEILD